MCIHANLVGNLILGILSGCALACCDDRQDDMVFETSCKRPRHPLTAVPGMLAKVAYRMSSDVQEAGRIAGAQKDDCGELTGRKRRAPSPRPP
jgi:hypothetical protein